MSLVHRKGKLISALNFAIHDKFKEHRIEIPYPQRDLHLRSSTIELKSPPPPVSGRGLVAESGTG
jgi:small-conductance mechanosensitive channel